MSVTRKQVTAKVIRNALDLLQVNQIDECLRVIDTLFDLGSENIGIIKEKLKAANLSRVGWGRDEVLDFLVDCVESWHAVGEMSCKGLRPPKNKCSICAEDIGYRSGHTAWPVNDGRCCDLCNDMFVIPARLLAVMQHTKGEMS